MIWRRVPNLFPIAAAVLAVNAPSLIVLGILGACGLLPVSLAVIAGAAIFILAALVVARPVRDLAIVRAAVDALSTDQGGGPLSQWTALKPVWPAGGLWRAIFRLDRLWRERVHAANEQLSAAEAVIAAAPDPLILLNQRRQIVGANIRATALVGATPERADLSVALRNPSALAAVDAVLRGEVARAVDFTLAAPTERQLRARIARIDRPSADGAVAVLSLHDITELKRAEQMRADFIANASHELRTPLS